jgi:glucose-6-phosphate isomerase
MTCMPITLDYTYCLAEAIGATHGLVKDELSTLVAKFPAYHREIEERFAHGATAMASLPELDPSDILALVARHRGAWHDVVLFGTGGSILAPMAVVGPLLHRHHQLLTIQQRGGCPRLHVMDRADPVLVEQTLSVIDPKRTLFVCSSQGGMSPDTLAMLQVVLDLLRRKAGATAAARQLIIATDPERSPLAIQAQHERCAVLATPGRLGGRFAILGPASLFIAGLCGLSVPDLLAGAADANHRNRRADGAASPAYMHAAVHYLLTSKRRKTIHVTWPMVERLGPVALWYAHLLAVSLGKRNNRQGKAVHVGPSPEIAIGGGDLHGQMQLYAEGPYDKVVTFITVRDPGSLPVPVIAKVGGGLAGADLGAMAAQAHVVAEEQLTASGRPSLTFSIERLDERRLAGLCQILMLSTVMSAELYAIDPYDQPGIDHACAGQSALVGLAGTEERVRRLAEHRARARRIC